MSSRRDPGDFDFDRVLSGPELLAEINISLSLLLLGCEGGTGTNKIKLYRELMLIACVWILQVIWNWNLLICEVCQIRCLLAAHITSHHSKQYNSDYINDLYILLICMSLVMHFHGDTTCKLFICLSSIHFIFTVIETTSFKTVKGYYLWYKLLYQVFYRNKDRGRVSDLCLEMDTNVLLGSAGSWNHHCRIYLLPRNAFSPVLGSQ